MKTTEWQKYIDVNGDFEFPKYLYRTISDMMKINLDLGTLVCNDPAKLRAYKERVKSTYKEKWLDIASVLEFLGIIDRCVCDYDEFCKICGGSRFILSEAMTADEIKQISYAFVSNGEDEIAKKLQNAMEKIDLIGVEKYIENVLTRGEYGQAKKER